MVTFTEEILHAKLHFLCSVNNSKSKALVRDYEDLLKSISINFVSTVTEKLLMASLRKVSLRKITQFHLIS